MLQVNIHPKVDGNSDIESVYSAITPSGEHRNIIDASVTVANEAIHRAMIPNIDESDYLLPPGCIYLSQSSSVAIFKQPPSYRWISYKPFSQEIIEEIEDDGSEAAAFKYRIPIPSTLYLIILDSYTYHLQEMYAFCYTSSKLNQDTELFLLPLNNYYVDGRLCMSTTDYLSNQNPYRYFSYLINSVWQENFNYDTTGVMNRYISGVDRYFGVHRSFNMNEFIRLRDFEESNQYIYQFLESISMSDAMNVIKWQPVHWNDSIDPGLTYRYVERYAMDVHSNSFNETSFINSIRNTIKAAHNNAA